MLLQSCNGGEKVKSLAKQILFLNLRAGHSEFSYEVKLIVKGRCLKALSGS